MEEVAFASTISARDTFEVLKSTFDQTKFRLDVEGTQSTKWSIALSSEGTLDLSIGDYVAKYEMTSENGVGPFTSEDDKFDPKIMSLARDGNLKLMNPNDATFVSLKVSKKDRVFNAPDGTSLCVRALGVGHAFVAYTNTGTPVCGHVHEIGRLVDWTRTSIQTGGVPCPECSNTKPVSLLFVGMPKRRAQADFDMGMWMMKTKKKAKKLGKKRASDDDKIKSARRRLRLLEDSDSKDAIRKRLIGSAPDNITGVVNAARKRQLGVFLKGEQLWTSKDWKDMRKPVVAIVLVMEMYALPLDRATFDKFTDVTWISEMLRGAQNRADGVRRERKRARERRDEEEEAEEDDGPVRPGEGKEEADPIDVLPIVTGRDHMKSKLNDVLRQNPSFNFNIYGRNRCIERGVRELAIGRRTSYQQVAQWAAKRLVSSDSTDPQGLMFYHGSGSGKTCSMWTALGEAWRVESLTQDNQKVVGHPYRPKMFFVTPHGLVLDQSAAKDVWCLYDAAGENSFDEIHLSAAAAAGASNDMGDLWKSMVPVRDVSRYEHHLLPRVISFDMLYDALLLGNAYGRAIYGYEVAENPKDDPFVVSIESPTETKIKPNAAGLTRIDVLMSFLNSSRSFKRLGIHDWQDKLRIAKGDLKGANPTRKDQLRAEIRVAEAYLADARAPGRHPLDPLRDACLVIDRADELISAGGEIGARSEVIERLIFHSYAVSGRNAVRLVLGTSAPAHSDIRSAFRLLNVLVVDPKQRVHGVGTPGTSDENPTIQQLSGNSGMFKTAEMSVFLDQIADSISRVNVEKDTDHFPLRQRMEVLSRFTNDNLNRVYNSEIATRIPAAAAETTHKDRLSEEDVDDKWARMSTNITMGDGIVREAIHVDLDLSDKERELRDVQRSFDQRATNMRRMAMMLHVRGGDGVPKEFQLGNIAFSPESVETHMAEGNMPKIFSLLREISKIDRDHMSVKSRLPKHVIISSVPLSFGAPLVGSALAAAGYYWRIPHRDNVVGIEFPNWGQDASGSSPNDLLPSPYRRDNAAFVVLDNTVLDMGLENDFDRTPSGEFRPYSDYMVVSKADLRHILQLPDGADQVDLDRLARLISDIARKPVYVDSDLLYTKKSAPEGGGGETDLISLIMDSGTRATLQWRGRDGDVSATDMVEAGIFKWMPRMTSRENQALRRVTVQKFNDVLTNSNGEFARIIVLSPEFVSGVDLSDVEYVHLLDPSERASASSEKLRTRGRIEAEATAWHRCAHAEFWSPRRDEESSTLNVLSYRLEGSGMNRGGVLAGIRSVREPVNVNGWRMMASSDSKTTELMHVDDIAQGLNIDPVDQMALNNIDDFISEVAFDRVPNTPRVVTTPVYTGYVYVPRDTPLYRDPLEQDLVTVDGKLWREGGGETLVNLWMTHEVRYEPNIGPSDRIPDIEKPWIESNLITHLSEEIAYVYGSQHRMGGSRDEQMRVQRSISQMSGTELSDSDIATRILENESKMLAEAAQTHKETLKDRTVSVWRKDIVEAISVLGVEVYLNAVSDLTYAAINKETDRPYVSAMARAILRHKYSDGTYFSVNEYAKDAMEHHVGRRIVISGGKPFENLLEIASRMSSSQLAPMMKFFVNDWGIPVNDALAAIRDRPMIPGESEDAYRGELFRNLAVDQSGRWANAAQAAHLVFGMKDQERVDAAMAVSVTRSPADVTLLRDGTGEFHDIASKLYEDLEPVDVRNFTFAATFAQSYIADIEALGRSSPSALYSRIYRLSKRLDLNMHEIVGAYMMVRMHDANIAETFASATDGDVVRVDASEFGVQNANLTPVLTFLMAGTTQSDTLMAHVQEFDDARDDAGIDVLNDAVRSLVDADGDWDAMVRILSDRIRDGEFPTGIYILDGAGGPFTMGDGKEVFSKYPFFVQTSRASLFFYEQGARVPTYVDAIEGKSWAQSIGTWIGESKLSVRKSSAAESVFGSVTMADAVRIAIMNVVGDDIGPPLDSSLSLAYDHLRDEMMARHRDTGGFVPIYRTSIENALNLIWARSAPIALGDHFFGQSKPIQFDVLRFYARDHPLTNQRQWVIAEKLAEVAEDLFTRIRDMGRRIMEAVRTAPHVNNLLFLDTTGPFSVSKFLFDPRIMDTWTNHESGYGSVLASAAAAATGMGQNRGSARQIDPVDVLQYLIHKKESVPIAPDVGRLIGDANAIFDFVATPSSHAQTTSDDNGDDGDIQFRSLAFMAMRITSPLHLKDQLITPNLAKRLVWAHVADNTFEIASGSATLESGDELDAWEHRVVVEKF